MFGLERKQKTGRYARDYEQIIAAYKEHIQVLQKALQDKELHLILTDDQIDKLAQAIADEIEVVEEEVE